MTHYQSTRRPRVLFIEPKSPDSHIFSIYPLPRLGTVLLATILQKNGFDARVLFEQAEPVEITELHAADIIGISTTTSTAPRAYAFADLARHMGKPVVIGGPHVTFSPKEALRHADYVVLGEAESIAVQLFQRLANGESVLDLKGVISADTMEDCYQRTESVKELDHLPIPDLRLISGFDSGRRIFRKKISPVEASRGCPFDCSFCSVTAMFGRRFRFRSVEHVMEELCLHDRNGSDVFFYDDNLAANRTWFWELLEGMAHAGTRFKWSAQVRIEVSRDRELLDLMKRTGCTTVFVGVESIDPHALAAMNKHQTPAEIREAMGRFKSARLRVHGMFILGMDTDTPATIRETVSWAVGSGFHSTQFLILTPFPGTRTYDEMKAKDRILFDDWSLYDGHHVTFQPYHMTAAMLQAMQIEAHGRFYSRSRTFMRFGLLQFESAGISLYARQLQKRWKRTNRVFQDLLSLMARSGGNDQIGSARASRQEIVHSRELIYLSRRPELRFTVHGVRSSQLSASGSINKESYHGETEALRRDSRLMDQRFFASSLKPRDCK